MAIGMHGRTGIIALIFYSGLARGGSVFLNFAYIVVIRGCFQVSFCGGGAFVARKM